VIEQLFVTSQGHPYARFRRAHDSGNPTIALSAAADLLQINLADALTLCLTARTGESRETRWPRGCVAPSRAARFTAAIPVAILARERNRGHAKPLREWP
jgi:hypothetical protein